MTAGVTAHTTDRFTARLRASVRCVMLCAVVGRPGSATAQSSGTFMATGVMTTSRSQHTATLLATGEVLIAGGESVSISPFVSENTLAAAEIYDPAGGTFRATGRMTTSRRMHTATLLPDNRVLIVGGYGDQGALANAELFDRGTGTFRATGGLITARGGHTAILLPSGKVLIVGGY